MKRFLVFMTVLALALGSTTRADGPDDLYVRIYNLIQQADELNQIGQKRDAFDRYQEAQTALKSLQKAYPDWHERVVQFRLNYLAEKLAQFGPPPAEKVPAPAPVPGPTSPTVIVEQPLAPADMEKQIVALREEARRLGAENAALGAKLREALSAHPAAVDPGALAKAEAQIRSLQKENDLLRVTMQQEKDKMAKLVDPVALEGARKELADANRKLTEQAKAITALTQEKQVLEARLGARDASPQLARLQSENETLKKQLAQLKAKAPTPPTTPSAPVKPGPTRAEVRQIKQLEQQRDELQKKLDTANKALADSRTKKDAAQWAQLTNQLAAVQARLEALEARKVPYTPEELALFKSPEPAATVAAPPSEKPAAKAKKSMNDLPAGAGPLVAEARRDFAARRYEDAEKKYLQVLSMDEKNVFTLGNLAAIQLERGRMEDAEANLKKALALEPNDPFNLSLWGILKFRQAKYNEAFDALSLAVKFDPKNPETQNYLGITLSQKGQRQAAESALREAIRLSPDYASAHYNLAVVYATQKPPFLELARYHYRKALSSGHGRNAEFEKVIEGKK